MPKRNVRGYLKVLEVPIDCNLVVRTAKGFFKVTKLVVEKGDIRVWGRKPGAPNDTGYPRSTWRKWELEDGSMTLEDWIKKYYPEVFDAYLDSQKPKSGD